MRLGSIALGLAAIALVLASPAFAAPKAHSPAFLAADLNHDGRVSAVEYRLYIDQHDGSFGQAPAGGAGSGPDRPGGVSSGIHISLVVTGRS